MRLRSIFLAISILTALIPVLSFSIYSHESPARNTSIGLSHGREIKSGEDVAFGLSLIPTGYEFYEELNHIRNDYDFTNYVVRISKDDKEVYVAKITPENETEGKFSYNFEYGGNYEFNVSFNNKSELLTYDLFTVKVIGPEQSFFDKNKNIILPIAGGSAGLAVLGFVVYKKKRNKTQASV